MDPGADVAERARGPGLGRVTGRPTGLDPELLARRGLLLVVAAAAVTAVLAGLARLGVLIGWGPTYLFDHGPLFVVGVFGTVIALERAVALGHAAGLIAPGLGAVAAIAMLAGLTWAPWVTTASAVALVGLNAAIVRRQAAAFTWLMLVGSVVLVLGDVRWARGQPVFEVVPAWIGFFVLTIVAERLELSRLAPTPRWAEVGLVVVAVGLTLAATAATLDLAMPLALRVTGVTMAVLASWQLRFDLARRTVRRPGLPRFAALGVLLGAGWLLVSGVLLSSAALPPAGPRHDAALHAVFVGYVLSMVFAHAPIILPAVARVALVFTRLLYLPLALLHLGLLARLVGDLAGDFELRRAGAIANALALAAFALVALVAGWRRPRAAPRRSGSSAGRS